MDNQQKGAITTKDSDKTGRLMDSLLKKKSKKKEKKKVLGPDRPSILRGFLKNIKNSAKANLPTWGKMKDFPGLMKAMWTGDEKGLKDRGIIK